MNLKSWQRNGRQTTNSSSILLTGYYHFNRRYFVWASVTELDNVVRGSGKTVSEAQNHLVQSSEPGVLRKRYFEVKETLVNRGEIII